MFRILPGVRPVQTPAERAASRAMEQRRTSLGDEIAQWQLVPADERNQVDGWDAARAMIIFHMYNENVRRFLYRAHITVPEEMEARLLRKPDIAGWGTKLGEGSRMIEPAFWIEFFTFVRLQDWNIDETRERVVLKRDYLTLEPVQRRPERNTRDFVRFYRALWYWMSVTRRCAFRGAARPGYLLRDIVLLYFVRCCLLHKNGRAVLDHRHFDWMGKSGRDAVWEFMEKNDPRLEQTRVDDRDYRLRVDPLQESWDNLLAMFSFGIARRYALCIKDGVASAKVVEEGDTVEMEEAAGEEGDDEEVYDEEGDDEEGGDEEGGEEAPGADEETPQPPAREENDEPPQDQPPAVPTRDETDVAQDELQKEIGAEVCPLHDLLRDGKDHFCPSKCMPRVSGKPVVQQSSWMSDLARCSSHSPHKLQQAAVMLAVGAEQPTATATLLQAHGAPTAIMRGHRNGAEWSKAMQTFTSAPQLDKLAMEHVDALAKWGGWKDAPRAERLARYATVYGAGQHRNQAWLASGWVMNGDVAKRLDAWREANPRPTQRSLQALATCLL